MEKDTLAKRLAKYSALAVTAVAGVSSANAQIGYTDKSPGDVYNEPSSFSIDIDGDAQNDFSFNFYRSAGTSRIRTGTGGGFTYKTYGSYYNTYLHTMVLTTNTFTAATYPLYGYFPHFINRTRISPETPSNAIMGPWIVSALAKPEHVSNSNFFASCSAPLAASYSNQYSGSNGAYGNFIDGAEHILGVKFSNGSGMHYGWIRLSVNNSMGQFTIMDYGYEETVDGAIHAGGFPTAFTNAGTGNWNDPANWNKGVPTEADDAVIPIGESVTLDNNATCFNFINQGNTAIGANTLNIGGSFFSNGNRFNGGTGTVNFTGNFDADGTRNIEGGISKAVGLTFSTITINNPNVDYLLSYNTTVNDLNINECNSFTNASGNTLFTTGEVINNEDFINNGEINVWGNLTNNGNISNNFSINIFGNLTNTSIGSIYAYNGVILKSTDTRTASLLNSGYMEGYYTMERYVTGSSDGLSNPNGRYWYLSSPFDDATSVVFDAAGLNKAWVYSESAYAYSEITDNATDLDPLTGYVARVGSDETISFYGSNFNDNDVSVSGLTRTGTTLPKRGFHLMGNPYPSSVDWDAATKTNLEPTMWYRTANGTNTMIYDTYNSSSGLGTNNNGNGEVTKDIPPMQAFWVYVNTDLTTGELGFTDAMRSHQNRSTLKTKNSVDNMLRLTVSDGINSDEAIVYFNQQASDNFDPFDSHKMFNESGNVPEIYTMADGQELAINGLQDLSSTVSVPLGFKTDNANQFSIKATELNFDAGQSVYLKDNVLNTVQDLKTNPEYNFSSNVANTSGRFEILFDINTSVTDNALQSDVLVFANNSQITVSILGEDNPSGELHILNLLGQEMYSQKVTEATTTINQSLATGTYLVKIQTKEQTITKKIVIK